MCLGGRTEVVVDSVDAFKLFICGRDGKLRSAFNSAYRSEEDLTYVPGVRTTVDSPDRTFFAFKDGYYPVRIAREGVLRWNLAKGRAIVLPVTLYDVVAEGDFHIPSDDPQCLDGYAPAWESRGIVVHDGVEARNAFYDDVLRQWWERAMLSKLEREAFAARCPMFSNEE